MGFFRKHWNGGYSIDRSFWINGFLLFFVVIFVATILSKLLFGNHQPLLLLLFNLALQIAMFVWWIVGMWRACKNPVNTDNGKKKFRLVKGYIVFVCFFQTLSFIGSLGKIFSHTAQ